MTPYDIVSSNNDEKKKTSRVRSAETDCFISNGERRHGYRCCFSDPG
jgi:hypothetical protein